MPSAAVLIAALLPPTVHDPYAGFELARALAFGQAIAFAGAWVKVLRLTFALYLALRLGRPAARDTAAMFTRVGMTPLPRIR